MPSVNQVILLGYVGQDAEVRHLQNKAVTNFSLATATRWKSGDEWKEKTEWHRIVVWGETGKRLKDRLTKGSRAYVDGRIQYRQYDSDGVTKYVTEIIASTVIPVSEPQKPKQEEAKKDQGDALDDVPPF